MINVEEIATIIDCVSDECRYVFSPEELESVIWLTDRKCQMNGKGDSYFPILLEYELRDFLIRKAINIGGMLNAGNSHTGPAGIAVY